MKQVRDGLFGNFIQLDRAVGAIGARLTLTTAEIDSFRSPNCSKADDDVETLAERAYIGRTLRRARAAGQLLQILNRVAEDRPKWYDVAQGFALLDESVSKEGTAFLVQWMKQALPSVPKPFGKWSSTAPQSMSPNDSPFPVEVPRSAQVGFDIDELIRALDAARVPHSLGEPWGSTEEGGVAPPVQVVTSEAGVSDIAVPVDAVQSTQSSTNELTASVVRPRLPPLDLRGPLSAVLHKALNEAWDPWNPVAVFEGVCRRAQLPNQRDRKPLLEFDGRDIKYEHEDKVLFFSKRNMTDRYRQLAPELQPFVVKAPKLAKRGG